MGKPMKNKKGLYSFRYRVSASMKVFDEKEKLLLEKDFGAITGQGQSKTWGEGAKSIITTGDSSLTPYEGACLEGVVAHAERVVFGLYGQKKISVPMGVAIIKKQKESKQIKGLFDEIMEGKKGLILKKNEMDKMQQCVSYWEGIISSTEDKYVWAVHYNLAIAYGWMINPEKSKEHIAKVYELNEVVFNNISKKTGSFNHKDIAKLEAYNLGNPFAEYYAQGITNYPKIVKVLEMDAFTMSHAVTINNAISMNINLPVILPIFPYEITGINMKKCSGEIFENGNPIYSFGYDLKKGILNEMSIKGNKGSKYKKNKQDFLVPNKADIHSRNLKKVRHKLVNGISGKYFVTKDAGIELDDFAFNSNYAFEAFETDSVVKRKQTEFQNTGSSSISTFTDSYFIDKTILSNSEWFNSGYTIGDSIKIEYTNSSGKITRTVTALDVDANGFPAKYEVSISGKSIYLSARPIIKSKFGETTNAENTRKSKAQKVLGPIGRKFALEELNKRCSSVKEVKDNTYDFEYSKVYDCTYKFDDKGNWIEISIGDYKVVREIKY